MFQKVISFTSKYKKKEPDRINALQLWSACSDTKHNKNKYSYDILKTGLPTAKSVFLPEQCQKAPKVYRFCTQKNLLSLSIIAKQMLLMKKNNISVKTVLLHEKNRDTELSHINF